MAWFSRSGRLITMATRGFQHRGSGYLRRQVCLRPIHVACNQKKLTQKHTQHTKHTHTNTHKKKRRILLLFLVRLRAYFECRHSGMAMSHLFYSLFIQRYLHVMILCYSLTIILKAHVGGDNAKSPCWISF